MKKLLLLSTLFFFLIGIHAQTDNYGLHLTETSHSAKCGRIYSLENAGQFTLEAWVNVETWTKGAQILSYGPSISIKLGDAKKIEFTIGEGKASVTNDAFVTGKWNLLTLSFNGSQTDRFSVFVNGKAVTSESTTSFPKITPKEAGSFTIGEGLIGWIDEIRVWKKALLQENIIAKATISAYNDNYPYLAAYYKCDQFTSPGLVDYSREEHHGKLSPSNTIRQKAANAALHYLPITGYVEVNSLITKQLDKKHLLMCNDIALLSEVRVNGTTGVVEYGHKEYKGTTNNAEYAENFTAPKSPTGTYQTENDQLSRVTRNGILNFKGTDAQMSLEALDFNGGGITFQTWLYVNTWTPGAAIFYKKAANSDEVSLKMGDADGEFIFTVSAEYRGTRYTEVYPFKTTYTDGDNPTGEKLSTATTGELQYWHFLNFAFDNSKDIPVSIMFDGFIQGWQNLKLVDVDKNNILQNGAKMPIDPITGKLKRQIIALPAIEGNMLVGKDLDGYMDEIAFWGVVRTNGQRQVTDALNSGLGVGEGGMYYTIQSLKAYYRILGAETVGDNAITFKVLNDILLSHLKGYRGCKVRLSITATGQGWQKMIADPTVRVAAAKNLAAALKDNPAKYEFAGLDFDFEWLAGQNEVHNYALFIKEMRKEMGADKILSIAINGTMPWTYVFTDETSALVDFYTAEDYGPFADKFTYESFLNSQKNYADNLPLNKVQPSIGIYAVGDLKGQLMSPPYNTFASLIPDADMDRMYKPGTIDPKLYYNFCGVNQSRKRAQYALDNDYAGFMFYHMSCDMLPTDPKSLTRAVAQVFPTNHESIVEVPNEVGVSSIAKVNGEPLDQYLKNASRDKANIVITGAWSAAQIAELKPALGAPNTLKTVDMSDFSLVTSETPILFDLFANCQKLESIKMPINEITTPVALGNTKNQGAFYNCINLKEVDLSMFTNITDLQATFFCYAGGSKLETIKMPTKKSTITTQIPANNCVKNCPSLKGIDLSSFNALNLVDAFQKDKSLLYVVLPEKFAADPFTGGDVPFNPEILVYAYSTYTNKHEFANFITTTDGENYTCATAITLNPEKEFYCPKAFTATKGISYTRSFSKTTNVKETIGWETICLPFNVTEITNNETAIEPFGGENANARKFILATADEKTDNVKLSSTFNANIPYAILMPNYPELEKGSIITGEVVFKGTEVAATDDLFGSASKYNLLGTYTKIPVSETTYAVNNEGSKFVCKKKDIAFEYTDILPFNAYAVSKPGAPIYDFHAIKLTVPTGIETPTTTESNLKVYSDKGRLIIEAVKAERISVSTIDGIVRMLKVVEGVNEFYLPQGLYIVDRQKVVVR